VCFFITEKQQIYSSDSDDAYDSDREISGAKRLLNAKKGVIVDDDEVYNCHLSFTRRFL